MDNEIPNNHKQVLSKDLNRETLFKLFFDNNILSIGVDKIGMTKEEQPLFKEREVRYGAEKLLFLHLLMDSNLKNQIEQRKDVKYDYMIGLLLYIASNSHFKYSFGYFRDCIQSFDTILAQWCKFLDAIIADINVLPSINLEQHIIVELDEILNISLSKGVICSVKINMDNFDKLFNINGRTYDFSIRIDEEIFDVGKSDGSGLQSNLYNAFSELNRLIMTLSLERQLEPMLIPLTHGH